MRTKKIYMVKHLIDIYDTSYIYIYDFISVGVHAGVCTQHVWINTHGNDETTSSPSFLFFPLANTCN